MSDETWTDVIVPSKLEPEEQWQRNGEYVYRDEAEEKLSMLETRLQAAEAALRVRGEWHIGRPSDLDESGACICCLVTKNAADAYFAVHGTEVQDANT